MRLHTAIILSALITFIAGCTNKRSSNTQNLSSPHTSNVAEVTGVTTRPDKVPDFSWKDSSGKDVDLDSYRGKVTLINFWATWCGPCKRELPDLVAISSEMASQGVKVIGISTDRGSGVVLDVSSFVTEHGIPYQVIISSEDLESAFGNIRAIPTSFIIDADGKIVQTIVGERSKDAFVQLINSVLK